MTVDLRSAPQVQGSSRSTAPLMLTVLAATGALVVYQAVGGHGLCRSVGAQPALE
jgi:hypothetical protein